MNIPEGDRFDLGETVLSVAAWGVFHVARVKSRPSETEHIFSALPKKVDIGATPLAPFNSTMAARQ